VKRALGEPLAVIEEKLKVAQRLLESAEASVIRTHLGYKKMYTESQEFFVKSSISYYPKLDQLSPANEEGVRNLNVLGKSNKYDTIREATKGENGFDLVDPPTENTGDTTVGFMDYFTEVLMGAHYVKHKLRL